MDVYRTVNLELSMIYGLWLLKFKSVFDVHTKQNI